MTSEVFIADKLVVASGSLLMKLHEALQITISPKESQELKCLINFHTVDSQSEANVPIDVEPLGQNGLMLQVPILIGKTGWLKSDTSLVESEDLEVFATFKLRVNNKDDVEFVYTFSTREKAISKPVKSVPKKKKATTNG
jgi:hypothetical protein